MALSPAISPKCTRQEDTFFSRRGSTSGTVAVLRGPRLFRNLTHSSKLCQKPDYLSIRVGELFYNSFFIGLRRLQNANQKRPPHTKPTHTWGHLLKPPGGPGLVECMQQGGRTPARIKRRFIIYAGSRFRNLSGSREQQDYPEVRDFWLEVELPRGGVKKKSGFKYGPRLFIPAKLRMKLYCKSQGDLLIIAQAFYPLRLRVELKTSKSRSKREDFANTSGPIRDFILFFPLVKAVIILPNLSLQRISEL